MARVMFDKKKYGVGSLEFDLEKKVITLKQKAENQNIILIPLEKWDKVKKRIDEITS